MKSELVYEAECSVAGIRDAWMFDDLFSVFVTPGIEQESRSRLGLRPRSVAGIV